MTVLAALLPSLGVTVLFVVGIRALVQADRRERAARAALESQAPRPHVDSDADERDAGSADPRGEGEGSADGENVAGR